MAAQKHSSARSPAEPGPDRRAGQEPARPDHARTDLARHKRRAEFLAELAEAKALRARVAPRRARIQELHARLLRTFRY